jgi:Flp pilus assembly protein TadB
MLDTGRGVVVIAVVVLLLVLLLVVVETALPRLRGRYRRDRRNCCPCPALPATTAVCTE